MTKRKSNLDTITPHRLFSRLRETRLLEAHGTHAGKKRQLPPAGCVGLALLGQLADSTSQRDLEFLAHRLHPSTRWGLGLSRPPSDTTIKRALDSLSHDQALGALGHQIRAMHKRGELTRGRHGFHHVAIDGKQVHWFTSQAHEHPCVQDQSDHGATLRVLRATHVGSDSSTCIRQSAIPAVTNEIGHLPTFLREVSEAYGRSRFIEVVSLDAGLCSLACAEQLVGSGWEYLIRLKSNQPGLHDEATRVLTGPPSGALRSEGGRLEHRFWIQDLEGGGWMDWGHAGSFVRIERVRVGPAGEEVLGERWWVSSLRGLELEQWGELCRGHWGCENGQHCVVDKHLGEDQRMGQLSRDPEVLLAVSVLRAMALNILNVLRTQRKQGYAIKRTYKQARPQISSTLEKEVETSRTAAFA